MPDAALATALVGKLKAELRAELESLASASSAATAAQQKGDGQPQTVWELVGSPHIDTPAYRTLDATVARVLSRFLLNGDGSRACMCGQRRHEGSRGARFVGWLVLHHAHMHAACALVLRCYCLSLWPVHPLPARWLLCCSEECGQCGHLWVSRGRKRA